MVPMCEPQSDLGSAQTLGRATLNQCPMRLFAITCPYELSDQAFCTSLALQLGTQFHMHCIFKNMSGDIPTWINGGVIS